MVKFTVDEKLAAVQRYLTGKESYATIGQSINVTQRVLNDWVMQYTYNGVEGLTRKTYTNYSTQFKLGVLKYMVDNGTSSNQTAAIFNISSPSLIRKWRRQFETQGIGALKSKKKGRPSMKKGNKKNRPVEGSQEALLEELERLRMENAYLKKLNALVQNKEKLQNKIKRK